MYVRSFAMVLRLHSFNVKLHVADQTVEVALVRDTRALDMSSGGSTDYETIFPFAL